MKKYLILLIAAFLCAYGADDFLTPEEEPIYYIHPLEVIAEDKNPSLLAEIKQSKVTVCNQPYLHSVCLHVNTSAC